MLSSPVHPDATLTVIPSLLGRGAQQSGRQLTAPTPRRGRQVTRCRPRSSCSWCCWTSASPRSCRRKCGSTSSRSCTASQEVRVRGIWGLYVAQRTFCCTAQRGVSAVGFWWQNQVQVRDLCLPLTVVPAATCLPLTVVPAAKHVHRQDGKHGCCACDTTLLRCSLNHCLWDAQETACWLRST